MTSTTEYAPESQGKPVKFRRCPATVDRCTAFKQFCDKPEHLAGVAAPSTVEVTGRSPGHSRVCAPRTHQRRGVCRFGPTGVLVTNRTPRGLPVRQRTLTHRVRRSFTGVAVAAITGSLIAAVSPAANAVSIPRPQSSSRPAVISSSGVGQGVSTLPKPFSEVGLFGHSDPTYDGVYRQGLAILGLRAANAKVPASAITWLRAQQCRDGGFVSYRGPGKRCPATDLVNFVGEDTNSTALGAMALMATGQRAAAIRALAWLRHTQRADGGFPYLQGGGSDANSTGLSLAALASIGRTATGLRRGTNSAYSYLRGLQLRCAYPWMSRGSLAYQGPGPLTRNDLATGQALAGLSSALIIAPKPMRLVKPVVNCTGIPSRQVGLISVESAGAGYVARALLFHGGALSNAFGPGRDWNATAWAVLALRAIGVGRLGARAGERALRNHVRDFALDPSPGFGYRPAALGTLLLVAHASGTNPRHYGGVNLVRRLRGSLG